VSKGEDEFELQLRAIGFGGWVREYKFHPTRKWRLDFAHPELMIAVEVEGITFYGKNKDGSMKLGRHQTGKGMEADLEKYQEAMLLGWLVYRVSPAMVTKGVALQTLETLIGLKGK